MGPWDETAVVLNKWEGESWPSVHHTVAFPGSGHVLPHCTGPLHMGIELPPPSPRSSHCPRPSAYKLQWLPVAMWTWQAGPLQTGPSAPCSHQPALCAFPLSLAPLLTRHGAVFCFLTPRLLLAPHLPRLHVATEAQAPCPCPVSFSWTRREAAASFPASHSPSHAVLGGWV